MKSKIIVITKLVLDFMFFSGIVVTCTVWFLIHFYGKINTYFGENEISLSIIFTISGILALLILQELRNMMKSVIEDNCFILKNVKSLNKMGNYSFLIAVVNSFRFFVLVTPTVMVILLVFLVAGLFSKVLSQVFDKAVTYKLENDLTI